MPTQAPFAFLSKQLPSVQNDAVAGERAAATASANLGFITEGIVGQRAVATASANLGIPKIAVTGQRAASTASVNLGSVTEVATAGGGHRLLLGVGA